MSPTKMLKCKDCGSPFPSSDEVSFAKCPACLRKDRMKEAAEVVLNVKTAKIKTPSKSTCREQEVDLEQQAIPVVQKEETPIQYRSTITTHEVDLEPQGDDANCITISTKISKEEYRRFLQVVKIMGKTQSAILRDCIEQLGDDDDIF